MTTAPVYWDPYDPDLALDRRSVFKRLRDEAPLYRNENQGFYALSRFADCCAGLEDPGTFMSGKGVIIEVIKAGMPMPRGFFICEDPPVHTVHRKILGRTFTAPRMARLEEQIRAFCARTLDPLVGAGRFDLIRDFASQVPMKVIGMLLGIPETDQEDIRRRADERLRTEAGQPMETLQPKFDEGFAAYIDYRINNPSDDLMSELIHAEFEDETGTRRRLRIEEVHIMVQMLAAAGNETTNKLIGWTAKLLAEHPEQRRDIVRDRKLLHPAIEEVLRFEPVGDSIARYVARDFEAYGEVVPAGSTMVFLIGAANLDEREFADPDCFDIHRSRRMHLTFGYGAHLCIGAALARLEGRIALDELLKRFPEWDVDIDAARQVSTSTVRGWDSLPIVTG